MPSRVNNRTAAKGTRIFNPRAAYCTLTTQWMKAFQSMIRNVKITGMMVFLKGEKQDSEEKRGEESQNRNSPTFNKRAERDNLNRVHLDEHNLQTAVEQDHKCHLLQTCGVLKTPSWRRKLSNCSLTGPEERYLAPCEAHHWSSMALSASMLTASVAIPWCNRDRHTTNLHGTA
jgi:hypothetical protein